jgi:hypothetical protein
MSQHEVAPELGYVVALGPRHTVHPTLNATRKESAASAAEGVGIGPLTRQWLLVYDIQVAFDTRMLPDGLHTTLRIDGVHLPEIRS